MSLKWCEGQGTSRRFTHEKYLLVTKKQHKTPPKQIQLIYNALCSAAWINILTEALVPYLYKIWNLLDDFSSLNVTHDLFVGLHLGTRMQRERHEGLRIVWSTIFFSNRNVLPRNRYSQIQSRRIFNTILPEGSHHTALEHATD